MFGVNLNSITNIHVYEDLLKEYLPFKVYLNETYKVKSQNNTLLQEIEIPVHNPLMSAKRDCERVRKHLIKSNYISTYPVGDSEISLVDAKGLTITLLQMLLNGNSIYGKIKLNDSQITKVNQILKDL